MHNLQTLHKHFHHSPYCIWKAPHSNSFNIVKKVFAQCGISSNKFKQTKASLEDLEMSNKNIYISYIEFHNALCFIDHACLHVIMSDLGYPQDALEIVGNIYENPSTSFTTSPPPNPLQSISVGEQSKAIHSIPTFSSCFSNHCYIELNANLIDNTLPPFKLHVLQ